MTAPKPAVPAHTPLPWRIPANGGSYVLGNGTNAHGNAVCVAEIPSSSANPSCIADRDLIVRAVNSLPLLEEARAWLAEFVSDADAIGACGHMAERARALLLRMEALK